MKRSYMELRQTPCNRSRLEFLTYKEHVAVILLVSAVQGLLYVQIFDETFRRPHSLMSLEIVYPGKTTRDQRKGTICMIHADCLQHNIHPISFNRALKDIDFSAYDQISVPQIAVLLSTSKCKIRKNVCKILLVA